MPYLLLISTNHLSFIPPSPLSISLSPLQLDGRRVRTPLSIGVAGARLLSSGVYSLLDTDFGLKVKFDGVHHLEITIPGEYFNKVRLSPNIVMLLYNNAYCTTYNDGKIKPFTQYMSWPY